MCIRDSLDVGHQQAVRHILDQLEHKLGTLYVHRHAGHVKHATVEVFDLEHGVLHRQASARRAVETRIVLVPQLVAGTVDLDQTIPIAVVREHPVVARIDQPVIIESQQVGRGARNLRICLLYTSRCV